MLKVMIGCVKTVLKIIKCVLFVGMVWELKMENVPNVLMNVINVKGVDARNVRILQNLTHLKVFVNSTVENQTVQFVKLFLNVVNALKDSY